MVNGPFQAPGSLPPPGRIGRAVRLLLAMPCAWFLVAVLPSGWPWTGPGIVALEPAWPWAAAALYLTGFVVNIGFGRRWGRGPQVAILLALAVAALGSRRVYGDWLGPPFGWLPGAWLAYVFLHLAASFLVAAALGTPGCEVRALPTLAGRLRGQPAVEHRCPLGPLAWIDRWERQGRLGGRG